MLIYAPVLHSTPEILNQLLFFGTSSLYVTLSVAGAANATATVQPVCLGSERGVNQGRQNVRGDCDLLYMIASMPKNNINAFTYGT